MKRLGKTIGRALLFSVVMMVICSFAYPLALTGLSAVTMKEKAGGNLIDKEGNPTTDADKAAGSKLVGQQFTKDCYFRGRISSVNYNIYTKEQKENGEYKGVSSGSYNYGNSNPDLKERIEKDMEEFLESHPGVEKEDIPVDLLTASGSGLDPHISLQAARIQVEAVALHSGLPEEQIEEIVKKNTEHKVAGVFGEERVNVLGCNLDIAEAMENK